MSRPNGTVKRTLGGAIAIAGFLSFFSAHGETPYDCRAIASETSFEEIIAKADVIALATADSAKETHLSSDGVFNFTFKVEEKIKGRTGRKIKMLGRLAGDEEVQNDLNAHRRMSFWDRMETRMVHVASCKQALTFKLGGRYLLIDPGNHQPAPMSVASELIISPDVDEWLKAVRKGVATPSDPLRVMTLEDYFKAQQSVAFAVMPYCNDKLRDGAFRVAEMSEPLWGAAVRADSLDPELYEVALEGCDGLAVTLGIFYQPDKSRPEDAALGATIYPGQQLIPVREGVITIADIKTEVTIDGPETITLQELIALLKES